MVGEIAEILQGQAALRQIEINLRTKCNEVCLMLDKMRI